MNYTLSDIDALELMTSTVDKANIISIMKENLWMYCDVLREQFKNSIINVYVTTDTDPSNFIWLNGVNNVYCSKKEYMDILNQFSFQTKPNIDYIRVITFGTYDLFHKGHYNILKRAKEFGVLYVGISTDELNLKKNKKSVNKLAQRRIDVHNTEFANLIFDEESLELKNDYVKKYACNLLIMGDDWKDGFNFCDCACLYLPRTPDISTTLLKQNLGLL